MLERNYIPSRYHVVLDSPMSPYEMYYGRERQCLNF